MDSGYESWLRRPQGGGVGIVLGGRKRFLLKVVFLLKDKQLNSNFWQEAESIFAYRNNVADLPGARKCPLPVTYWIHQSDPLYMNFPRSKMSEERLQCLEDQFTLFDIKPCPQLPHPEEYWLVPEILLKKIYEEKLESELLLTFPVEAGGHSLATLYKNAAIPSEEAEKLLGQILRNILQLYEQGKAHGDIKPANIIATGHMLMGRASGAKGHRFYSLTDFGSLSSEAKISDSGTPAFFSKNAYRFWREHQKSELECRTLMDAYALGCTMYNLVTGKIPGAGVINSRPIKEKLPGIAGEIAAKLLTPAELSITNLRKYAEKLPDFPDYAYRLASIATFGRESEIAFDVLYKDPQTGIEYGKLHEQLPFSPAFIPLARIFYDKGFCSAPQGLFAKSIFPMIETCTNGGMLKNVIFQAPDNLKTMTAPQSFENYIPCTLAHTHPEGKELEQILKIGEGMNAAREEEKKWNRDSFYFPAAEAVMRINGKWKIQWGLSGLYLKGEFDCTEYLKMLCGQKTMLPEEITEKYKRYQNQENNLSKRHLH